MFKEMAFVLLNWDKSSFESSVDPDQLIRMFSKTCVKRPLSNRPKIGFQDQLLLNAG